MQLKIWNSSYKKDKEKTQDDLIFNDRDALYENSSTLFHLLLYK
jgi:hypothetical protein